MNKIFLILINVFILILTINFISASDVSVWQGQYYTGTTFNTGTYEFNFTVYDDLTGGNICYSNTTTLTTGSWGEWKTEQFGVSSACNNASKDYYLNININGIDQTPRKRLVVWNSLRKDVNETTTGTLESSSQIVAPVVNATLVIASIVNASQIVAPVVNATQVATTNVTTINYGFFSFLGNLISRITKLFVTDIDVLGNINGAGNITITGKINTTDSIQGNYYSSDGSQGITDITGFLVCTDYENKYIASAFGTSGVNGIYTWDGSSYESGKKVYTYINLVNSGNKYGYSLRWSSDGHWMLSNYGGAGGIYYENAGTEPESDTWFVSDNGDSPAGVVTKDPNSTCRSTCILQIKNGIITGCT